MQRPEEYVADIGFDDMAISPEVRRALAERGYKNPTPVQAKAFAPMMEGKDLIVRSKTGTGKTAAFGLPLFEKIQPGEKNVKALIMCPTRELAIQVAAELQDLGKYKGIKVSAIYGGASMKQQEDALEDGSNIVVGTPGRVYDHIRRKNLKLEHCSHVILDEADEMLNQGFYEEVTRILDTLPKDRQVLLFSATVPPDIQNLIAKYTTNAETLLLSGDVFTVEHIHHIRYDLNDAYPKPRNLIYVLEMHEPENAIVFCNTKDDTALVVAVLNRNGFDAELLNGDLPQKERERVMAKVKRGEVAFMVATDIAARGIDISGLGYVINYSLPEDPAVYLHRVGRTGRIGNKGTAINLISGRELGTLTTLEKKYGIKFEKRVMPAPEEAGKLWFERHVKEIRESAGGSVYEGYLPLAEKLKLRPDADDLVAFLLKSFFIQHRKEKLAAAGLPPEVPRSYAPREEGRREERSSSSRGGRSGERERGGRSSERGSERSSAPRERAPRRERPTTPTSEVAASSSEPHASGRDRDNVSSVEGTRTARPPRAPRVEADAGQVRLWVNIGKSDTVEGSADLVAALEAVGAPAGKVGKAELRPSYSYVFVADEDVGAFEALNGKPHQEKPLKIERARDPRAR